MKRTSIVLLGIVATVLAQAQPSGQRPQFMQGPETEERSFCYYQAVNLISDDTTKSRVDVLYRIDQQFFVAIKNTDTTVGFPFKRRGEVYVDLLDKDGVSKARGTNRFEVGASNSEQLPDEKAWYEGFESFSVAPGEYTVVFEIIDLESERRFLEKNRKITAKQFNGPKMETSTPLFVMPEKDRDSKILTPIDFGGNILFGKGAGLFIQLQAPNLSNSPVHVEYSISTKNFMDEDSEVIVADTIAALPLLNGASLAKNSEAISYTLGSSNLPSGIAAILLPLHAEKLPLRPFVLDMKITQGPLESEIHLRFRMIWPEMPLSLRDIDFALDALKYITREGELDSLRSGSREVRLNHLEEFWKSKDRTPNTAFNEVMEEYYRRVDYARRTYGSLRGTDGYKTDRGRIYILYGPPTKTERALDPAAGYQEIWTYDKQSKKFVFLDQTKSGNYTLVATQNL